jgi:predicted RNA-binding protein with PUA-like domain
MSFRCGNQGPEMWPKCRRLGVAAITYEPLMRVNLSKYPRFEPRRFWAKLAPSQKASLRRVAYEMKAGDVIYVKKGPQIVGKGVVRGSYQFSKVRLIDHYRDPWAHQVPVDWELDFPAIKILLGAEQLTVKKLAADEVRKIEAARGKATTSNQQAEVKKEMGAISSSSIKYWWVTASEHSEHPWHWSKFFENPDDTDEAYDWGGPDWIKSRMSFVRIKEMRKGNIVVAYQADEGVVGLAYLVSNGYQHAKSGNFDTFDLKSSPVVWLHKPVPYSEIRDLPNAREHIEFVQAKRGTVFRIDPVGFKMILNLILKFNPSQHSEIRNFLSVKQPALEAEPVAVDWTGKLELPPRATFTINTSVKSVGKQLNSPMANAMQKCIIFVQSASHTTAKMGFEIQLWFVRSTTQCLTWEQLR